MEVSWVSLIIGVLCSRSSAIDMKKDNISIIEDFYLLDKEMQLEICNMIKETNTSVRLALQDQIQIKRDFCDHLESLINTDVEHNSLQTDDRRSLTSDSTSQRPAIGARFPLSSITENPETDTTLPDPLHTGHGSSSSSSTAVDDNLSSFEVMGSSINPNNSLFPNEDITLSPSIFSNAQTTELIALSTTEESVTSSDWPDHRSTELSYVLNTKGFIINSNTPMVPDPTYSDLESNSSNSLESSTVNPSNVGNKSIGISSVDESNNATHVCANMCQMPSSNITDDEMSQNHGTMAAQHISNNSEYLIEEANLSPTSSSDESSSPNKEEKCLECFNKSFDDPHNSSHSAEHPMKGSIEILNKESSILTSNLENSGSNYDGRFPVTTTKVIFNRPCVKCLFKNNDVTTSSSNCSSTRIPHSQIPNIDELSSEFKYNADLVEGNRLVSDENNFLLNNVAIKANETTEVEKTRPASDENNFQVNDTITAKETIKGFLQEIHVLPPNLKDTLPKSSTSGRYSDRKLSEYDLCLECLANSSSVSNQTLDDSTCHKYCGIESSSYNPLQLTFSPTSSSELKSLGDFTPKLFDSSESSEITYDTLSSITHDLLPGSVFPIAKSTRQSFYRSSITTPYAPLSATKSTSHFCGSTTSRPYQSINTATSPNSTTRLSCNALKLTVDPKLPRASRRRTKIVSSIGNLHSYAGFFKTDQQDNVRLFFWFFCNRKWKNIPLIVWLQGEPGQSSLHGLFQEHGPYYIEQSKKGVNIKLRQFSWTKEYSVLYLDHCVGCGFSSADGNGDYTHSYANVAKNIYEALSQFFKVWYEMLPNDLYLAGSYAGAKYIPVIAHTIHTRNEIGFCTRRMNLKGLIIGGPYMDSTTMVNYNDFLLANGVIDEVSHKNMIPNQYHAQELIRAGKYQDAIDFLNFHVYCFISQAGYEIYKDVRFLKDDRCNSMQNVVQSAQFKKMICLDKIKFEIKSDVLIEDIMPPMDNLLIPGLLSHYKILYYNGQFDLMAPHMLTSKALSQLEWESIDEFFMTEMVQWCPAKDRNSCPTGYYRNYQNLTHLMVRNAGHSVGATNSESLFYLLKWFVEGKFQRYNDNDDWHE